MHLRKMLNNLLKRYGYELTKRDMFKDAISQEYCNSKEFVFVQIGANDGVKFDDLYDFVTSHKCRGVVVEPLTVYYEKLVKNYLDYPNIIPVNCAIHRSAEVATLHYVSPECLEMLPDWAEGIGSLDPVHLERSDVPSECVHSEEVKCMSIMALLNTYDCNEVNLIQIDVEGYDGEVIKMIDFDNVRPKILKYENHNLEKKEQREVKKILRKNGYRVFRQGIDNIAISKY